MAFATAFTAYSYPLLFAWLVMARQQRKAAARHAVTREAAHAAGLTEPVSLHPVIDPALCRGCGACVRACPEGEILGLIDGRAELIEPSQCIGHGACRTACPFDAISLVFGTETRGVDIPNVGQDFQTNVPGVFIAGELGGMGLIRNAIEQGRQAIEAIASGTKRSRAPADWLDVVIVGAGPAGLAATLAAKAKKLRSATIEQYTLGGTVAHFPRGKLVMTSPADLPLVGKVKFREISKEKLLAFWEKVVRDTGIEVQFGRRVDAVVPLPGGGFEVSTGGHILRTKTVLLAIGRRGTPRELGVPGEEQPKVVYRLTDAEQYRGLDVTIVGGGDSAVEAALAVLEQPGSKVTLSHRGEALSRVRVKNRQALEAAVAERRISVLLPSRIVEIGTDAIAIEQRGRIRSHPNDAVIICIGGVLPAGMLKDIGIEVTTKRGTA